MTLVQPSLPPASPPASGSPSPDPLRAHFRDTRARTLALASALSDADATAQSMPAASPAKWHLAHTTWFFETFVLEDAPFRPGWDVLFNSYYNGAGAQHPRAERGLITRPALEEVIAWRAHVDAEVERRWDALDPALITLGLNHEEQHQELLQIDILHLFAHNPALPAPCPHGPVPPDSAGPRGRVEFLGGKVEIGTRPLEGFRFDCEMPVHPVWLVPFGLAKGLVTHAEWAEFIADGGYRTPALWLSDGWDWVEAHGITAPLYASSHMTLQGPRAPAPGSPVRHISFFEAEAFARWRHETGDTGARLPTEFEWEHAARSHELPLMFGGLWQWTVSAFLPYPGFRPAAGVVGEYNGKFMNGLRVLRGSSFATPPGHSRASYRNFFAPTTRWQFTGLRLAYDL